MGMNRNVFIIAGFLGSGKTTLINHLLSTYLAGKNIVVVENEAGRQSVDGPWLRSRNYAVRELTGGCVCCTLRMDLPRVLSEIEETFHPDGILIEPSGLASLEELLRIPGCRIDGAITLIDVTRYGFLMQLNPDFYGRQFRLSPVVFLTRTEQVHPAVLEKIKEELLMLSPDMELVTDYRRLNPADWERIEEKCRYTGRKVYLSAYANVPAPTYARQTLSVQAPLDIPFYVDLFNRINSSFIPSVIRLKGIIPDARHRLYKLDGCGGRVSVEPIPLSSGCPTNSETGFLSIYREETQTGSADEWLAGFVNALETDCAVQSLPLRDEELYRYAGFGDTCPDAYMQNFIARLKREALSVCRPRFGYRLVSARRENARTLTAGGQRLVPGPIIVNCLKKSDFYAAIVASAGEELQTWIEQKRAGEDIMEAFIADALGSVIVEAVVSWGVALLEKKMAGWNLNLSNPYSPGYCGWDVAEQPLFFSLFPPCFCGISLTGSCLMLPIKSVSALVGIGKEVVKKPYGCAICRKKDCYKRKEVEVS